MRLEDMSAKYKSLTDDLNKAVSVKTRLEERLSVKQEELNKLLDTLSSKGVDTENLEKEYKTRKEKIQESLEKFEADIKKFEEGIEEVKGSL